MKKLAVWGLRISVDLLPGLSGLASAAIMMISSRSGMHLTSPVAGMSAMLFLTLLCLWPGLALTYLPDSIVGQTWPKAGLVQLRQRGKGQLGLAALMSPFALLFVVYWLVAV